MESRSRIGDLPAFLRDALASYKKVLAGGDEDFVENTGVEPVTSCMPCKRSSQLS